MCGAIPGTAHPALRRGLDAAGPDVAVVRALVRGRGENARIRGRGENVCDELQKR